MTLAITYARAAAGLHAPLVAVETHISPGMPSLHIVGMPETAVKESRERVRSALLNSGFEFPIKRITINLAPADLPKEGGSYDLAIALGILAASRQIRSQDLASYEFAGELALSGKLRPVKGLLPLALAAKAAQRSLILPAVNASEAALAQSSQLYAADHLLEIAAHLNGEKLLEPYPALNAAQLTCNYPDLAEVKGQLPAKRALTIAAAGGHSILFFGPPGTGKTMLASRLPGLLPELSDEEKLAVAAIYSISKHGFSGEKWGQRPFRAPHHTASAVALVGGGSQPKPGEISLAHHGILFLDELPEFDRKALEVLREPLETHKIIISRANNQLEFPANFQLVAAMNPCPCGYLGDLKTACQCLPQQIKRYRNKISGPLLDRIDLQIEVAPIAPELLADINYQQPELSTERVKQQVSQARERQMIRQGKLNYQLSNSEIAQFCQIDERSQKFLINAMEKFGLSARSFHRILKVARTIADLTETQEISFEILSEVLAYRKLDRAV